MSRLLAELLEARQPLFNTAIKQLEKASGSKGVDIQLGSKITNLVKQKTKDLKLDPGDSTPVELYHALLGKMKVDDNDLNQLLGVQEAETEEHISLRIVQAVLNTNISRDSWVIKKSVAKDLLKKNPPKNLMTVLNYRSIDSMLKNEPILQLCAALRLVEDSKWMDGLMVKYKKLQPSDFETRPVEIIQLPHTLWNDVAMSYIAEKGHTVTHMKEFGVIGLLPASTNPKPGSTVQTILLLVHYIAEIKLYSTYFKLQQVKPRFGEIIVRGLMSDTGKVAKIAGQDLHWRVIHRHFGSQGIDKHPEAFEPHVQPEDLFWQKGEDVLSSIAPLFKWWEELSYCGVPSEGRPVSFNVLDVSLNCSNHRSFDQRQATYMQNALWNALYGGYLGEQILENQILQQLEENTISTPSISKSLSGKHV